MNEPCDLVILNGIPDYCVMHRRYHHGHHRKWAIGTDEESARKRAIWTSSMLGMPTYIEPKTIPMTATEAIANYASTLKKHIAGGRKMVSLEVHEERRNKCNACEYRDTKTDSCKICHCSLSPSALESLLIGDKLWWAVASCPIGEWVGHEDDIRNLP